MRVYKHLHFIVPKSTSLYKEVLNTHFRGETDKGEKFVYCPVKAICSWHPEDYSHEWCHICKIFYKDLNL